LDSRPTLPANTVLDGSYRILRVVGSGGFGITYEAEDLKLGTTVAMKEYYPFDFADRAANMSVQPKSDRHKKTFEWGRSSFLQEARTLARFRHPSIVRATRVFEEYSTAYMVMDFETGQPLEGWLKVLGRPPTQEELDRIASLLLDALEMMHAADFLHRDIAPDNIIIRPDGTPVLLDFGAARRAVAEASRSITGIVKAGYSPHEQYSSDSRLQGPWSDIYAVGATLYRAVTGRPPEESTLRVDFDGMASATQGKTGTYRPSFLDAIDVCLKIKQSERPQSVAELRPILLRPKAQPKERLAETGDATAERLPATAKITTGRQRSRLRLTAPLIVLVLAGGTYGGFEYKRWIALGSATQTGGDAARVTKDDETRREADAAAQRRAALDVERQQREKEAADARQRQIEIEEARRRKEMADAAEAEARRNAEAAAEARRKEEARIAALEEARRNEDDARRKADADAEAKHNEDERIRLASAPNEEQRAAFVRRVQQVLKRSRCYDGALNGLGNDAQEGVNKFVDNANKRGRSNVVRIVLAKANVGEFESWLKDADAIKVGLCPSKVGPVAKSRNPEKAPGRAMQREDGRRSNVASEAKKPSGATAPLEKPDPKGSGLCWKRGANQVGPCGDGLDRQ
jgi:hypothetical protein